MRLQTEHRKLTEQDVHNLAEVGLLSAGIIHEVKNALQGIANALYLLDQEQGLEARAKAWIADARRELARAVEVSHDALTVVREESMSPVRVTESVDEVLKTYAGKISYKGVAIERRYEFHETIQADPMAVRQIFSNIVLNALEAAPGRAGRLVIHARASQAARGKSVPGVRITFTDNGPGVAEENKRRVFEPLFSTKRGKGSGLGLWVTEKLVRRHRGTLQLRSRSGKGCSGSCFSVFLPVRQS